MRLVVAFDAAGGGVAGGGSAWCGAGARDAARRRVGAGERRARGAVSARAARRRRAVRSPARAHARTTTRSSSMPSRALRRKVIVSDLHLGPGTADARFAGIEDFYADAEWARVPRRARRALGPTDLVIAGDFIEFWQIADRARRAARAATIACSRRRARVLAADQAFAVTAIELVIAAHADVFRAHRPLDRRRRSPRRSSSPATTMPICCGRRSSSRSRARSIRAIRRGSCSSTARAYEHARRPRRARPRARRREPVRDRGTRRSAATATAAAACSRAGARSSSTCFYTETERQIPFIDNLYPESAGVLWAHARRPRARARPRRGDALRRAAPHRARPAASTATRSAPCCRSALGTPARRTAVPSRSSEVLDHVADRLVDGDASAEAIADALARSSRPTPSSPGCGARSSRAGARAARCRAPRSRALATIDPDALRSCASALFGDSMDDRGEAHPARARGVDVVVFGHTHRSAASLSGSTSRGRAGYYANTGSWISVASVAELRARASAGTSCRSPTARCSRPGRRRDRRIRGRRRREAGSGQGRARHRPVKGKATPTDQFG